MHIGTIVNRVRKSTEFPSAHFGLVELELVFWFSVETEHGFILRNIISLLIVVISSFASLDKSSDAWPFQTL